MSIPRDYLIQLAQLLRNAGIIEATAGKHGGYRLARKPSEISLLEISLALNDDSKPADYAYEKKRNDSDMVKKVKKAYQAVLGSFNAYLGSITLDVLLACALDGRNQVQYIAERLNNEGNRLQAKIAS